MERVRCSHRGRTQDGIERRLRRAGRRKYKEKSRHYRRKLVWVQTGMPSSAATACGRQNKVREAAFSLSRYKIQRGISIVFFGATGDLAYKQIFSALHAGLQRGEQQLRRIERFRVASQTGVESNLGVLAARQAAMRIESSGVDVKGILFVFMAGV